MVDSSGAKSFKRNGVYVTDPVLSDGTASFTPSGEVRGGVKTTFYAGLKSDDVQTSASQVIGASKVFDAFGNELSSTGAWKSQFGYAGKFGYQQDPDSGLKLLGHRYYDSSTGRFLTRDPIKDGRNWYSYCGNNPVSRQDRDGLSPNDLPSDPNDLIGRGWREEPHWGPNTRKFLPPWVGVGEHGPGLEFDTDPGKGDHYHEIDKKGKRVKPGSGDRHGHLFPGKRPVPPDVAEPGKAGAYEDTQKEKGHYSDGGKAILDGLVVTAVTALIVFALVTAFTGGLGAPIAAAAAGIIGGGV